MANKEYQYSNGFDLKVVLPAMMGRLAWLPSTIADSVPLDDNNTTSRSGRYFNDGSFHSVVTTANLKACQEDPDIDEAAFNAYLQNLQQSAILRALNNVCNEPEYLEQVQLYERYSRNNDVPINNTNQAVGYEIQLARRFDVAVQVTGAVLYFDQDVTFKLYLFRDGGAAPIWEQSVTAVAYEPTLISIPDLYMLYPEGSTFYLCYFQSELGTARAIQEDTCGWNDTLAFCARAFNSDSTGSLQFNRQSRSYPAKANGLNLHVTSFKDWSRKIKSEPGQFDNLVGLNLAYMAIEQMIYAVRSNGSERILKDELIKTGIVLDLNGAIPIDNSPQVKGLKQRIDSEAKRVKAAIIRQPKVQTVNYGSDCERYPGRY